MSKEDIIRKLTSRKLWVAVCSFVAMILVARGFSESEASQITSIIMAGASAIAYIIAEGLVDSDGRASDTVTGEDE